MHFSKKLFLLFSILFLGPQAWTMDPEDSPKKSICLMNSPDEYGSSKWLPGFTKYCEQRGRQKQRLENEEQYTRSYVRFVKDIATLTVGYGVLFKDNPTEIPGLQLSTEIYQDLAAIGTAVKIINGYIQKYDLNANHLTYTPNTTNVFVPHISYVIQWEENTLPQLVPGGMLHDEKGRAYIFMSGNPGDGESVESFYNLIFKEKKDSEIVIYSEKTAQKEIKSSTRTGFNSSHTEPLFIELISKKPELLTQALKKIINDKPQMFSKAIKPKFLGLVIDSFSWLDTCEHCGKDLHTNASWEEALKAVNPSIAENGFMSPFQPMKSLFRVVAQEPYGKTPSDISKAEGGKDYTASGWDYRVLSEMGYTLATRTSPQESRLCRDRVFEKIPTAITRAALAQPIELWKEDHVHWLFKPERPFANNITEILFLRFQEHKVIQMIKIEEEIKKPNLNFEEVYKLAKSLIDQKFDSNDETLLRRLAPRIEALEAPNNYLKIYFAEACLKRAQEQFKQQGNGWGEVKNVAQFGFLNRSAAGELTKDASIKEIALHITNYWKKEWQNDTANLTCSLKKREKKIVEEAINLLWGLAYQKNDYSSSLEDGDATTLKSTLDQSKLLRPGFLSQ